MVVTLGNEVHRIKVKPGPEGMQEFEGKIRTLFNIPEEVEFEVSAVMHATAMPTVLPVHVAMSEYTLQPLRMDCTVPLVH